GEGILEAATMDWQLVMMIIWAVGATLLALWLIHVNHKFAKRIVENRIFLSSVEADEDDHVKKTKSLSVYRVDDLDSPCLMAHKGEVGIYVPSELAVDEKKLRFAIAHEICHYKHRDLIWAILRGGLLAFYWFNPLVWVAAVMSKRDCELACDYSVLKTIGKEERLDYGRMLVDLIKQSSHKSDVMQIATTMYGNSNGIKERIIMITKNKKMKSTALMAVLLIALLAVGCTFTAARDDIGGLDKEAKKEIEAFAIQWADAFSERDARTIHGLTETEELYLTIGSIAENGEYWMGLSSPWPWEKDYVIEIEDDSTLHIYYYFRTSDPSISVGKQTMTVKKIEGEYKAAQVTMKYFDSIASKADFDEAYKFGFPDFMKLADTYQAQADENVRNMAVILENPASAAIHQLNLSGAKVSGVYVDPYGEPPLAVVKLKWADGEVEINLMQPMLTDESGAERQGTVWIVVNEELKAIVDEMEANIPKLKEEKEQEYNNHFKE
ncbi:MAG: M56 family metallopeptidase, partial [Peptostreptococcales bacterium]